MIGGSAVAFSMITVAAIYLAHELSKGLKPSEETKMSLIRLEKKRKHY